MYKSLVLVSIILGLLGLCGSCQRKETSFKDEKTLVISTCYSPYTLDPRKMLDPVSNTLHGMLYDGLMRIESDGSLSYGLARHVEVSEDELTYTFLLKETYWSDGKLLTAYDFEYAWKQALDPRFPSRSVQMLFAIQNAQSAKSGLCDINDVSIQVVDDQTLVVVLERPTPYFLELITSSVFYPVPSHQKEWVGIHKGDQTLVCGPFSIEYIELDSIIILKKNPRYWNASNVFLDKINILTIKDSITALHLFNQSKIDVLGGMIAPLPMNNIVQLRERGELNRVDVGGVTVCILNHNLFPFNNINIRKAFAYALDDDILGSCVGDYGDRIATGLIPAVLKDGNSEPLIMFSKEQALAYLEKGLAELGISKSEFPEIQYAYYFSDIQRYLAQTIQQIWKMVLGIDVKLQSLELKNHIGRISKGDFTMGQMTWMSHYPDPTCLLNRFYTPSDVRNYGKWHSPSYSRLLDCSASENAQMRQHYLDLAEQELMEDMPLIPISHMSLTYLHQPYVHNIECSQLGKIDYSKVKIEHSND